MNADTAKPMRLVMRRPSESGITPTLGTKLFTADGSAVTGIASVTVSLDPQDIVKTTVVLNQVVIEYEPDVPPGVSQRSTWRPPQ